MDPYPQSTDLFRVDPPFPPVILVGRVLDCVRVGSPRISKWDGKTPSIEFRTSVIVENVLKGTLASSKVEISFFVNALSSGPPRLGTIEKGGTWHMGDREIFFLQLDSGHLRTVCDTWAHCVVPVLSGFHASLQPRQDVGEVLADILFTRGQGTSDAQMIKGMEKADFIGFAFARDFSMKKLEELVQTETPPVRQAACHYLQWKAGRITIPTTRRA